MFSFLEDLFLSLIKSICIGVLLFIGMYSYITHEFPPNVTKMRKAYQQLSDIMDNQGGMLIQLLSAKPGSPLPTGSPDLSKAVNGMMEVPAQIQVLQTDIKATQMQLQQLQSRLLKLEEASQGKRY